MLKDILAISGYPGLYKLVSHTKNGVIVESLESKKRMPAYSTSKISALEDIAIYTEDGEDKQLGKVFKSIREKENGNQGIDHKVSNNDLKDYFETIMPDYDKERVYVSDIKKVIQWYNILHKVGMLELLDQEEENDNEEDETSKEKVNKPEE